MKYLCSFTSRRSRWEESVRDNNQDREDRNWRWSESPDIELESRLKDTEKKRSHSPDWERSQRSTSRNERYERNERTSSTRSLNNSRCSRSPGKHHRSKSHKKSRADETASDGRSSKKRKKKSKRRSDDENDHKEAKKKR